MRRSIYSLSLIAICLFSQNVYAQAGDPRPLTLKQATDYALKNNVAVKNAKLDVLIQEAVNGQITATAYPRINGKAEFMNYIDPVKALVPGDFFGDPGKFVPVQFTPKYQTNANISASQLLFDGSVMVALQARRTVIELVQQSGKLTEENVKYNVHKAYHALVLAQKQFEIIKRTLSNARDMARELDILRESGFVEKIDIDRTSVQINNLASDSMRVANLLEVSEQLMKFQMGMDVRQPVILTDTSIEAHVLEASAISTEDREYNARTEYRLLQSQLKLNEYNVKRYKLAALPSLSTFGGMGYNYGSNNFRDLTGVQYIWSSFVGLQLNVPIFNGFQRTNQMKEAKLNVEKSKNNIEQLKLAIDFQTETARTSLRNALLQTENQRRNMALANSVLDLARRKYKEGVGSSLEVTQAQTEFLQAQNNYFNSLMDIVNSQADLMKALGTFK